MLWRPWPYRPRTCFSPLVGFIRSMVYGFRNLAYWLPVIWSDRSHHHSFISKILHHKLADMANSLESCGQAYGSSRRAAQIRECVCLLERLANDEYEIGGGGAEAVHSSLIIPQMQDMRILFLKMSRNYHNWWD